MQTNHDYKQRTSTPKTNSSLFKLNFIEVRKLCFYWNLHHFQHCKTKAR